MLVLLIIYVICNSNIFRCYILSSTTITDKGIDNRARQLSTPEARLAKPNCNTS
jgi:hypothetical protein